MPDQNDPEIALLFPNTDPTSDDLRCGRNASISRSAVKTATVQAGDTVGFGVGVTELEVSASVSCSLCLLTGHLSPTSSQYLSRLDTAPFT